MEIHMERLVFPSKVDSWFVGAVALVAISVLFPLALLFRAGSDGVIVAIASFMVLPLALIVWVWLTTYYALDGRRLFVHSGPFSWTIELADIRDIYPSRSLLSSPALSMDRLRVTYGRSKHLLVSPRNKEVFLAEIEQRTGKPLSNQLTTQR
jgi:hypothetical protein